MQGKFDYAKRLLQRFADWQCKDSTSSDYGRIPNRVRAGEIVYNTADGTPWFIRELYEYSLYSGGWNFVRENFAVVVRALQGTMIYHTDDFGFLTHGDAETWMDAVGPDGPWTPRGNRAVEIQALWIAQLESTIRMAERIGWQDTTQISEWKEYLKRLRKNYRQYFINEDYKKGLYDHLNTDGSPDLQVRPNQLFAFTIPLEPIDYNPFTMSDPFYEVAMYSAGIVAKEARYKYGIASLSVNDENFHPYHQFPLYPKDAAYHNGIIWTWLSGVYKSISHNISGWQIAESEMDLVLHQGAPGTLCEVMDVVPREGETIPRLSGTVTQAWSLAEFIRTFYQNTIGVKTVYFNNHRVGDPIEITPHLPMSLGNFQTVLNIREGKVLVSLAKTDSLVAFTFQTIQRAPQETLIRLFGSKQLQFDLSKDTLCVLNLPYSEHYDRLDTTQVIYQNERGNTVYTSVFYYNDPQYQPIEPQMPKNLKCLQPPGHRLLSGAEVKAYNPQAQIICDISDPTGDDIGDGNYLYPTEANFQPGILDLTRFVTRYDEDNVYFRLEFLDLVQPGWHPEYGFQLTFAAICIRTGEKSKGDDAVGHNSNWQLQKGYEADRFIYVGGGILVEDGGHKILAEHIPWEAGYELGNAEEKRINFVLPRTLLPGAPENWKITVLIGSQDDHGGAGIGEFRNVEEKAGRWVGGGGKEGGSNVYDWAKFPK